MDIRPLVAALIHADRGIDGCDDDDRHFFLQLCKECLKWLEKLVLWNFNL
jgi:hypothetical protein